jgi:hypothetical protein
MTEKAWKKIVDDEEERAKKKRKRAMLLRSIRKVQKMRWVNCSPNATCIIIKNIAPFFQIELIIQKELSSGLFFIAFRCVLGVKSDELTEIKITEEAQGRPCFVS